MDDFTVVVSTAKLKDVFAQALAKAYTIKRLREHQTFLGWTVQRHKIGDIHVSQPNAINYILEQADMSQCNGKETPYCYGVLLHKPTAKMRPKWTPPNISAINWGPPICRRLHPA